MDEVFALSSASQSALPELKGIRSREAAREVAEEFEAMFLSQMIAPMFEGLDTDGVTGGGAAERAFRPMLIEEYAKQMSKQGGIGIADQVYTEILRMQGLDSAQQT